MRTTKLMRQTPSRGKKVSKKLPLNLKGWVVNKSEILRDSGFFRNFLYLKSKSGNLKSYTNAKSLFTSKKLAVIYKKKALSFMLKNVILFKSVKLLTYYKIICCYADSGFRVLKKNLSLDKKYGLFKIQSDFNLPTIKI